MRKEESMKNMMKRLATYRNGLGLVLGILMAFILSAGAVAQPELGRPWITAASAGTVDEEDVNKVEFNGGFASLKKPDGLYPIYPVWPIFVTQSAVIRYNVVPVDGVTLGNTYRLTTRFRDDGANAQVLVRLAEFNLHTGRRTTRMELNSDNYSPSAGMQLQTVEARCTNWELDFVNNAYFVEVTLTRTNFIGNPGIGIIKLESELCLF